LKKLILLVIFLSLNVVVFAQHRVGVRAGTQYSKFRGPLEDTEQFGFASGIHFGINYTYQIIDDLGIRAEILYSQRGSKQTIDNDNVYSIVRPLGAGSGTEILSFGEVDYDMKYANSYFSIPITAHYELSSKWEVYGGVSLDFLIGANGNGKFNFTNTERPEEIFYNLSYNHRYGSDIAGGFTNIGTNTATVSILLDGESTLIPKVVGAYYHFPAGTEVENRFKSVDASLVGGLNYFINPGFYLGARIEYGLLDLTNNRMDVSLIRLDEDNRFILRDDVDKNISIGLSFGFRF